MKVPEVVDRNWRAAESRPSLFEEKRFDQALGRLVSEFPVVFHCFLDLAVLLLLNAVVVQDYLASNDRENAFFLSRQLAVDIAVNSDLVERGERRRGRIPANEGKACQKVQMSFACSPYTKRLGHSCSSLRIMC